MPFLTYILQVWSILPSLVEAGIDIMEFWEKTNSSIKQMQSEDRDPTAEEWEALNKLVEDLRAQRPDLTGE